MKKVTLVKSLIGAIPNQKATAKSLGLRKIGDSIVCNDDAVLAGKVLLKPAANGTGIIAGDKVRKVLQLAGIHNVRAKCLRSNNPTNVVKATMAGLAELRSAEEVAKTRDISVEQVKG